MILLCSRGSTKSLAGEHSFGGSSMAACRSVLSGLVLSAVVLTGLSVPATAQTPTTTAPVALQPATLAPAGSVPLNLAVAQSLLLGGDDLPPAFGPDGHLAGSRSAAGMVSRSLTDRIDLGWNPTTGNLLATGKLLSFTGTEPGG